MKQVSNSILPKQPKNYFRGKGGTKATFFLPLEHRGVVMVEFSKRKFLEFIV